MTAAEHPQAFDSRADVLRWLQKQNYRISRSKFYPDCDKFGLTPDEQDQYSLAAIQTYIKAAGLKKKGETATKGDNTADLVFRKQVADTKKAEQDARYKKLKSDDLDKILVDRREAEGWMVKFASLVRQDLLNLALSLAPEVVEAADGDKEKVPEVQEKIKERVLDMMDRYNTDDGFEVPAENAS